jgi:hypothetical protein
MTPDLPRTKLRAMFYDRAARRFPLVGTDVELEQHLELEDASPDVVAILRVRERYVAWALERYDAGDIYDPETDEWRPPSAKSRGS